VVRHPSSLTGLEDIEGRGATLAFGSGAQARSGGVDFSVSLPAIRYSGRISSAMGRV